MSNLFLETVSIADKQLLGQKISDKSIISAVGCRVWLGSRTTSGYGKIYVNVRTLEGSQFQTSNVAVHRLAYYLRNGPMITNISYDVSHLCHNKLCTNTDHLSFEPRVTNSQRTTCVGEGICVGHGQYLNCII